MKSARIALCALLVTVTGAVGLSPATASSTSAPRGAFTLTSAAFADGGVIPKVHECTSGGGSDPGKRNESPPLTWSGAPTAAKSYAIVMRDVDNSNLIHWVIYDIPASTTTLPQNVDHAYRPSTPAGARQVYYRGSASLYGYQGPCSPSTVNTYDFVVHALDQASLTSLNANSSTRTAAREIAAASIGSARITGES
ncbi:YbhB/YbcL family Raf kinase inhibitor-like protein [Streptomyces sp. AC536]|uniref:YbhB/YbcL family Raf kinase inhibitor-like protein n=1 Tax=Streptomyces buecherae TaxID=2763006 RepID=UPI00164CE63C|nr:YbhB/YbcL family Raf kinase inhibitor-like protein [Streptomyces buecherae]MBC3987261.1 YbhB/YbcL family Raf kinase inhibitor-like protein [Streptomyces buecherae]QNJ38781.1 YbhB/YbcL family Raf kinase inhibitor-like protein [Streptomyces buecherae]